MLTDTAVSRAARRKKRYKLADKQGLYLAVMPTGAKAWRYEYRLHGRRETLTIGNYPALSLTAARRAHAEARQKVEDGISPAGVKRAHNDSATAAKANTFKAVAEEWYTSHGAKKSASWRRLVRRWLDQRVHPILGDQPVMSVSKRDVLRVCEVALSDGFLDTAHRCQQIMAQIFEYAAARFDDPMPNPARAILKSLPPIKRRKLAALSPQELPALMTSMEDYGGRPSTRLAMRLLMLTFVRKSELIESKWDEYDLERAEWRIPATRMKGGEAHIVPLSRQAAAALKELKSLSGSSKYVLPHVSTLARPMCENTLNKALELMGYSGKFSPHAFRRTASTLLNEQGYRPDVIERQLAHVERNKVRAAYNKATYLDERRKMMQSWADYLDGLAQGGKVVPIGRKKTAD